MITHIRISGLLCLIIALFCCTAFPAFGAEKTTPELTPTDALVNIYCTFKMGNKTLTATGSGVFISERGVILTNAHVAQYFLIDGSQARTKGGCSIRTGSPAMDRYTASVLYIPPAWLERNITGTNKTPQATGENDFALLYVTGAKKGDLPLTFPSVTLDPNQLIQDADSISLLGYPSENLSSKQIKSKLASVLASSTVTNTQQYKGSTYTDVITVAPSPVGRMGSSGGPILDSEQELIALITSKSAAKDDTTLRGITLSYINRSITNQTAFSLQQLLAENFAVRAMITSAIIPEDTISTLAKSIRKKK